MNVSTSKEPVSRQFAVAGILVGACALSSAGLVGCDRESTRGNEPKGAPPPKTEEAPPTESAVATGDSSPSAAKPKEKFSCPESMKRVTGGTFWVGTEREVFDQEENPKFRTQVAGFCADTFEVSTKEFESCVEAGKCEPSTGRNKTCNTVAKGRENHPINCIDHAQASAVCAARGARLPTEIEWEYMARGGEEMRDYPWGSEHPDGKTCWKHAGSCERGEFAEGAFGLHDVVGNLWEWTDSWFGRYPWPLEAGRHKVYRGGSWSRRFEKWMKPTLRNRLDPKKSGSHLGVRCVMNIPQEPCPYGEVEGRCRHGVDEVLCLDKLKWNGVRCAKPGDDKRCAAGSKEVQGYGCVRGRVSGPVSHELDTKSVVRARSPEFDSDCATNTPGRPKAYRFTGGGHLARNVVGKQLGCKNRDVGVGFNSSCCP